LGLRHLVFRLLAAEPHAVAGPYEGRTGRLAGNGKGMLFSAVAEERVLCLDPARAAHR
jgi:hypothetical protein